MTETDFWELIEASSDDTTECKDQIQRLVELVAARGKDEIISFCSHLYSAINLANRWDVRAAAFIINSGCSDDYFDYFVGWLISKGRAFFTMFLASPEQASLEIEPGTECQCEEMRYVAEIAFESVGGDADDLYENVQPLDSEMLGSQWDETEVYSMYPKLAKKFAHS